MEDSIVDGPGLRLTVFCQGCGHACPGCHNPATHDPAAGRLTEVAELLAVFAKNPLLSGLTLSGGEPFDQPQACAALAEQAKALGKSVWVYSGYLYEALQTRQEAAPLLAAADVLVDGPFVLEQRSLELKFRGSRNQRLIDLHQSAKAGGVVLWQDPWEQF